jgi:hypothetical protein
MNRIFRQSILFASLLAGTALSAQAASINLAGVNGSGYAALAGAKATASESIANSWDYAYYVDNGLYRSIVASPLSADNDYSAISSNAVVKNVTDGDFKTLSAGSIGYDETRLTGVGTEVIGISDLSVEINSTRLSPYYSSHNNSTDESAGDFPFNFDFTTSNLTGTGLTFVNGQLTSIDIDATLSAVVQIGDFGVYIVEPGEDVLFGSPAIFAGTLSIAGASYVFDIDVNGSYDSVISTFNNVRFFANRSGDIAAVTAVPEPSTYAMMFAGIVLVGALARRGNRGS